MGRIRQGFGCSRLLMFLLPGGLSRMGCVDCRMPSLLRRGELSMAGRLHKPVASPPGIRNALSSLRRRSLSIRSTRCRRCSRARTCLRWNAAWRLARLSDWRIKWIERLRTGDAGERCRNHRRGDQSCDPKSRIVSCFFAQDSSPHTKSEELEAWSKKALRAPRSTLHAPCALPYGFDRSDFAG